MAKKKMTKDEAYRILGQLIVDDPSDVRIGWVTEEDARTAADALETIKGEKWLVSAYRPRQHTSKLTYFCYRVVKGIKPKIFHARPEHDDED